MTHKDIQETIKDKLKECDKEVLIDIIVELCNRFIESRMFSDRRGPNSIQQYANNLQTNFQEIDNFITQRINDNLKNNKNGNNIETKQHFPGEYGYKDIIKFKRKRKIVEGIIVGIVVSCIDTNNEYVIYKVHLLDNAEDRFNFYEVRDDKIIKD